MSETMYKDLSLRMEMIINNRNFYTHMKNETKKKRKEKKSLPLGRRTVLDKYSKKNYERENVCNKAVWEYVRRMKRRKRRRKCKAKCSKIFLPSTRRLLM